MSRSKQDITFINGEPFCSVRVACALTGVSNPTMRSYLKKPNPPPYNADLQMYDMHKLGEWIRREQIYKKGAGGGYAYKPDMTRFGEKPAPVTMPGVPVKPNKESKEDQEVRYKRLRADKLEMEIAQKAGVLIFADEAMIAMTSMVSRVKTRLLSVPTSLAPLLVGKRDATEIQSTLEESIRAALEELSNDWREEIDAETD